MTHHPLLGEIRWERIPTVARQSEPHTWLSFQAARGLAANTLDAYGRNLERYLCFLQRQDLPPGAAKQEQVAGYLQELLAVPSLPPTEGRFASATIQQHLTTLRLFYDYLVEENLCPRNPFRPREGVSSRPLIRREQKLPWIPNEEEWQRVLQAASEESLRNRLMFALSYDAALRREELCLLETSDIDPAHRTLHIHAETTKSRRSRVLPYSAVTDELFRRYLPARRALSPQRGLLFLSESRRNRAQPVSFWTWSKVVARLARRAGVSGFSPHTLRHLCLTDLARAHWDLHEIATFAGHRQIETTMIYIHLSARDLAAKFAATMTQVHERRLALLQELFG